MAFSIKKNAQLQHKQGSKNKSKVPFLSYQIVFLKKQNKKPHIDNSQNSWG